MVALLTLNAFSVVYEFTLEQHECGMPLIAKRDHGKFESR